MRRQRQARERQEKKDRRLMFKKLCSAVVQGAAQQKNEGSARDNWDPREGQQQFRPNPNGVEDCTTTLRRLLIGGGFQC